MKKIGSGKFTTAFLKDNGRVLLKSTDRVKECMANGRFPDHRLFPTIETSDREGVYPVRYYEMEYFPRTKGLKPHLTPRQWRLYQALRKISADSQYWGTDANSHYMVTINAFKQLPSEFKAEREALLEAVYGLLNYSRRVYFEISPRNVAVKGRKLILLDCFFVRG